MDFPREYGSSDYPWSVLAMCWMHNSPATTDEDFHFKVEFLHKYCLLYVIDLCVIDSEIHF